MEISLRGKEQLGLALRRLRKAADLTQTGLSEKSRIDQAMISKIESSARLPELATLFHLCSVLGVEVVLRSRNAKSARAPKE